eukprot:1020193-Pelagomonas_calceolata.AAC.1
MTDEAYFIAGWEVAKAFCFVACHPTGLAQSLMDAKVCGACHNSTRSTSLLWGQFMGADVVKRKCTWQGGYRGLWCAAV